MNSICKVILVGRLGKDPEVKTLNGGTTVATLSVAVDAPPPSWHRVVMFGKVVDNFVAKYVHKGDRVFIDGTLNERTFKGQDGPKTIWEVTGNNIMNLTPKGSGNGGGKSEPAAAPEIADDDIPF
jgi:single-strand DNA-binding protein